MLEHLKPYDYGDIPERIHEADTKTLQNDVKRTEDAVSRCSEIAEDIDWDEFHLKKLELHRRKESDEFCPDCQSRPEGGFRSEDGKSGIAVCKRCHRTWTFGDKPEDN